MLGIKLKGFLAIESEKKGENMVKLERERSSFNTCKLKRIKGRNRE
jgi:hypothetical protein